MLTPVFSVTQTNDAIIVAITAKYAKPSSAECYVQDDLFVFNVKPFYLRLRFSGQLNGDDELIKCTFDVADGVYTVRVLKLTPGEEFTDLDMLSKLLATKKPPPPPMARIEVMDSEGEDEYEMDAEEALQNWEMEQTVDDEKVANTESTYGFANRRSDIFQRLSEEASELFELYTIAQVSNQDRTKERVTAETAKFDEEHYLADLFEPTAGLLAAHEFQIELSSSLTKEEQQEVMSIRASLVELNGAETRQVYCALVELLFAYCYTLRCFNGELEPEAATMIARLAPSLSWLDTCSSPRQSIRACVRRALIYPLYRSFSLAQAALADLIRLLGQGRIALTKVMLEMRSLFNRREPFFLLNQLYLDDYVVWLQSRAREENMDKLARNLTKFKCTKEDVDLDVPMLERVAQMVMAEGGEDEIQDDVITMEQAMEQLGIELKDNQFVSALDAALSNGQDNEPMTSQQPASSLIEEL